MINSELFNIPGAQPAPYSLEAEEATIGAVLIDPATYYSLAAFLKADDFFLLRHRYIWEAFQRLVERDQPLEYLTVLNELRDIGRPRCTPKSTAAW